jgi:purine-binding chemotaxis protein CheW
VNAAPASIRHLTFRVDGGLYALPADEVIEVIRMPAMARVPQGPAALLGVANLRGTVLPIASLRVMLGLKPAGSGQGVAIVLDVGAPVAIEVDEVASLQSPAAEDISTASGSASEDGVRLRGAFNLPGSQEVARIPDIRALLDAAFARRARSTPQAHGRSAEPVPTRTRREALADRQQLVTFEVAGQEFALPLEAVQEILPAPDAVTAVVRADAAVLGLTAVREQLLPLLSLRTLLGFTAAQATQRQKVVVLNVGDTRVGLVADRTRAILAADSDQVDPLPPVLAARTGGESRIQAIYRGDGGRRLVSILAPDRLFQKEVMQQLNRNAPAAETHDSPAGSDRELIFLVFRLGDDEFGLPIDTVVEVAQVPEQITRVPRTPKFLEGVVNLRGEVLPVVDQRRRFEMPPAEPGTTRRLVVVRTDKHRAGVIVDSVSDVLRTTEAAVLPPPELTDATARLVHGVLNIEASSRLVLLLDPAELLTRAEQGLLDAFKAGKKANA